MEKILELIMNDKNISHSGILSKISNTICQNNGKCTSRNDYIDSVCIAGEKCDGYVLWCKTSTNDINYDFEPIIISEPTSPESDHAMIYTNALSFNTFTDESINVLTSMGIKTVKIVNLDSYKILKNTFELVPVENNNENFIGDRKDMILIVALLLIFMYLKHRITV
jgi:hypothetical protein